MWESQDRIRGNRVELFKILLNFPSDYGVFEYISSQEWDNFYSMI